MSMYVEKTMYLEKPERRTIDLIRLPSSPIPAAISLFATRFRFVGTRATRSRVFLLV